MTPNGTFEAPEIRDLINNIALAQGVDLNLFGSASPTKIFTEALIKANETMETVALITLTEQNAYQATTLKSLLGIAASCGFNVTTYLQASKGRIRLDPGADSLIVKNRSQIQTPDGTLYYIAMPTDFITITGITDFDCFQGQVLSKTFSASGEQYQQFILQDDFIVDPQSIKIFVNGQERTIGYTLTDDETIQDFFMSLNSKGDLFVMPANISLSVTDIVRIDYASCYGYIGDQAVLNTAFDSPELTSMNPGKTFDIRVVIPILGGTERPSVSRELPFQILGSSINNLIGNSRQLERYLKRYNYFITRVSENYMYVLTVTTARNIRHLVNNLGMNYWQAAQEVEMDMTDPQDVAEFDSLKLQVDRLPDLQLSQILKFVPARIQYVGVKLDVRMEQVNHGLVSDIVAQFGLDHVDSDMMEIADLLTMINSAPTVFEVNGNFTGSPTNQYGNVVRATPEHILIIDTLYLTVNGVTQNIINVQHNSFNYHLNFGIQS